MNKKAMISVLFRRTNTCRVNKKRNEKKKKT